MNERERFVRGTLVAALGLVVAGLAGLGFFRMWEWALGLAAGALVSLLSFRLIVASVIHFTEHPALRPRGRGSWWARSLLRLVGVAMLLLVVIIFLPVNLIGMALGLTVVQLGMGGYLLVRALLPGRDAASQEQK